MKTDFSGSSAAGAAPSLVEKRRKLAIGAPFLVEIKKAFVGVAITGLAADRRRRVAPLLKMDCMLIGFFSNLSFQN